MTLRKFSQSARHGGRDVDPVKSPLGNPASLGTASPAFIGAAGCDLENRDQMRLARLTQPPIFYQRNISEAISKAGKFAWNNPACIGRNKIVRRTAAGDDDRQAAG